MSIGRKFKNKIQKINERFNFVYILEVLFAQAYCLLTFTILIRFISNLFN